MKMGEIPIDIPILFYTQIRQCCVNIFIAHASLFESFHNLCIFINEISPLFSITIRITRRKIESLMHKASIYLRNSLIHNFKIEGIRIYLIEFGIERDQLRIAIEHLFKMRHLPLSICCIAEKASIDLIIESASRHPGQTLLHHRQCFCITIDTVNIQQK